MSAPSRIELGLRLLRVRWRLWRLGFAASAGTSLDAIAEQPWGDGPQTAARLRQLARLIPRTTCLHRSLTLIEAAEARGLSARLVIGAQRAQGQNRAHAWVQMGQQLLGETQREGRSYSAFPPPTGER